MFSIVLVVAVCVGYVVLSCATLCYWADSGGDNYNKVYLNDS